MTHSPKCQRSQAGFLSGAFFLLAVGSYLFSLTLEKYIAPCRLITICAVCGGVFVLVRYLYTGFTYRIVPRSSGDVHVLPREDIDFRVERRVGKRAPYAECVLSLGSLVAVREATADTADQLRREYKSPKLYYYTMALKPAPGERIFLVFEEGGEVSCIAIEPDEKMKRFLISRAAPARGDLD